MDDLPGSMEERSQRADDIVRRHVGMVMGAGSIPILGVDMLAVMAVQVAMVRQLCTVYSIPFEEQRAKSLVGALMAAGLARTGARRLVKAVPVVGWLIGGVSSAVMAGAGTYALGKVFKKHLEAGGTLPELRVDAVQEELRNLVAKGKEVVSRWTRSGQ